MYAFLNISIIIADTNSMRTAFGSLYFDIFFNLLRQQDVAFARKPTLSILTLNIRGLSQRYVDNLSKSRVLYQNFVKLQGNKIHILQSRS